MDVESENAESEKTGHQTPPYLNRQVTPDRHIDALVYELRLKEVPRAGYGLTEKEIAIVDGL